MADIALRGNRLTAAKGGRAGKFGGGRTNLLEQLGRVEGERSNPNRRAEISRVHGELNRGYATGGRAGFKQGEEVKKTPDNPRLEGGYDPKKQQDPKTWDKRKEGVGAAKRKPRKSFQKKEKEKKTHKLPIISQTFVGKPGKKKNELIYAKPVKGDYYKEPTKWGGYDKRTPGVGLKSGGRIGLKKGGNGKWMQKVSASIKKRGTKGKCTPITKPGCTGRAKALAKTFKKIAAKRKA